MKVYHVICNVDNGISVTNWSSLVCAQDRDHAAELIQKHWNSQYDTSAKVLSIGEVLVDTPTILINKEL